MQTRCAKVRRGVGWGGGGVVATTPKFWRELNPHDFENIFYIDHFMLLCTGYFYMGVCSPQINLTISRNCSIGAEYDERND